MVKVYETYRFINECSSKKVTFVCKVKIIVKVKIKVVANKWLLIVMAPCHNKTF